MANKCIQRQVSKFARGVKQLLLGSSLLVLAACGSNSTSDSTVANPTQTSTATSVGDSKLLASLAASYPNGKLPADRAAQAEKDLGQNPAALLLTAETHEQYLSQNTATSVQPQATAADFQPVQRIQNASLYGAYFFSIYPSEVSSALSTHSNWRLEGPAFWASLATGTSLYPVHRFQNKLNGSYLYTIYDTERADIVANYAATFAYEGVAWYAQQTPGTGWSPLYRFRNKTNGTYLFSAYESEKDAIVANYPDVFALEGIGYYVRQNAPVDVPVVPPVVPPVTPSPTVTSISPTAATLGQATTFTVIGTNLPLTAIFYVQDVVCLVPTGNTASGFSQICSPGGTVGVKAITVKTASDGAVIDTTHTVNVTPVPAPFIGLLTDTGITTSQCYQAGSNALVSCTSAAAIALNSLQDGMLGRDVTMPNAADGKLGFSYSNVLNAAGGIFDKTECVKDNLTELIWEGKPTSGLRSNTHLYSNYDDTTSFQKDTAPATQVEIDVSTNSIGFQNAVNALSLCGFSDWRLPTAEELDSLVDAGVASPTPAIDGTWFVNTSVAYPYWTASRHKGYPYNAWVNYFGDGRIVFDTRADTLPVRLVRGASASVQNRYSYINSGAEVVDSKTGLTWRRCIEGMTWTDTTCTGTANTYMHEQALVQAKSQTGWRLPNRKELASIVDRSRRNPAIDSVVFPNTPPVDAFWSSSPYVHSSSLAWVVYSDGGSAGFRYRNDATVMLRLVR